MLNSPPLYKWVQRYFRPPGAKDYVPQWPWEPTPYMLLGNGMPTAKTFDPLSRIPAFDVPLGYTTSGVGGPIHGDYTLTALGGVQGGVQL